jgi:nucleoside-diphosphate-sugar epimerase
MNCALVTGGTGFIGGHLVERLLAGNWHVRCAVRSEGRAAWLKGLGAEICQVDRLDARAMTPLCSGMDCVFHVAGATAALRAADFSTVNASGTAAMAEACAAQNSPPVLIGVSSVAAAGPSARGCVKTESDEAAPISHYGRSKLGGEQALRRLADGVPTTIVRPGIVFGPRDRACLSIFAGIAQSGMHVYPRWRTPPLSIVYVQDLIELLIAAAERGERLPSPALNGNAPPGQGIYFACRDEYPTYHEFGRLATEALGRKWFLPLPLTPPIPFVVAGISQLAGRLRGKPSMVNLDKIREAIAPSWACSAEKARRDLGFSPAAPLSEQLRATVAWYRAERWL